MLRARRILIIGQSHMVAVQKAYEMYPIEFVASFIRIGGDQGLPALVNGAINGDILERLQEPHDAVITLIGGNRHNVIGLTNHPVRFDFVLPDDDQPLDGAAALVPYSLMRRYLTRVTQGHLEVLALLRRHAPGPLFHVESPPPVPSADHIRRHPGRFSKEIDELGVAPASLRYKLWRAHSSLFRDACDALGITFIAAPAEMQDERGMLVEAAWNPDPTHGNAQYGACVLDQIHSLLLRM
jgi:hypothetical protein